MGVAYSAKRRYNGAEEMECARGKGMLRSGNGACPSKGWNRLHFFAADPRERDLEGE